LRRSDAYIDVGATCKRVKSLALDLSHLTAVAPVANCIPLVTTAIDVLLPTQAGYPKRLAALGCDAILHVRGPLHDEAPAVAIVGARAASRDGMTRAHAIARHLGDAGVRVISGGALGIDGAAHRGALDAATPTSAAATTTLDAATRSRVAATTVVLGSGIDVLYPARHASLFDQIVARGGALVSMFPRTMKPRRSTFPQRNPLIAALSDVVLVVEAQVHSGSMSTAMAARQQNRPVAACPGSPGTDALLAGGAAFVDHGDDILALLAGLPPRATPGPVVVEDCLDHDARAVLDAIRAGAPTIDSIAAMTGLPVRAVIRALPQLESCPARMQ
jgi:DNA processing protein